MRITDWFFFKDKIVLHYAGLSDATIYLHRSDSVWNYQYLVDYFSGSSSGKKNKTGIELDLKKIKLDKVSFVKKDEWRGENMELRLGEMDLDADQINFATRKIDINSLEFTDPVFIITNYSGSRPKKIKPLIENEDESIEKKIDSILKWNVDEWIVHITKLHIDNGDFKNIKISDSPYNDYFDGRNIDFASINGTFKNVKFEGDTLTTQLELSTKERSGFEVKSMVANARLTPNEMAFDKMEIRTNNSVIRDYFSMKYEDFNDMSDFITKIRMQARFDDAEIDSDDIAFFAPALSDWKKRIRISGLARGTVDDMFGNEIKIQAGQNTYLYGDVSLSGLPDINRTFIDFKANNLRTNYRDASTFLPGIKRVATPRLQSITYLNFTGSFTGFLKDFVTYGTFHTNLGTVTSDLNMKLPDAKEPFYSGNIASKNFDLGRFLDDDQIGTISFSAKVRGKGLKWRNATADVDANIKQFTLNNYHYENIVTKGFLDKKIYNGDFSIKDTNAVFTLHGKVDISSDIPGFDFVANVDTINFKKLNLLADNYSFKGKVDFNFTGNNFDNFLGKAKIREGIVSKDKRSIPIDSLLINSEYADGIKHLTIKASEFDATIDGDFSLNEMPKTINLFLNKYYPSYIKAPRGILSDQAFNFTINTNYVSDIINLFDTSLQGFNNTTITGKLNTKENLVELNSDVPAFAYKQFEFQNVQVKGKGNLQNLALTTTIDHLKVSDSLSFPYTKIDLFARNDSTKVGLITESSNKNISGGSINALVRTFDDGIAIKFDTSNFFVNGKKWVIEENGELELRSNTIPYGEIVMRESNQEITIKTRPSGYGDWNDLKVGLKNFNIGDVTDLLVRSYKIDGLMTGDITIEDPLNKFNINADLQTDQLRIDNDSIGQIQSHVFYNNKTGNLTVNGKALNPDQKLDYNVNLFLKNLPTNGQDEITVTPVNYPIKIIERFIGNLFTDLNGYVTGQLKIIGKGDSTKYIGKGRLKDAGLKVIYTQVYYKINDADITFKEDGLDLGQLKLVDTITNNTATITKGVIKHHAWKDLVFDIQARVDNDPILLLNTTAKDNSSFYGYAKGTGTFSMTGPQSNTRMKIIGKASETDSAYITIPNTTGRETGIADYLIERKYGRELNDSSFKNDEVNLTYDVDITGNPRVNVRVVLDELTNDEIRGRGDGNLRIIAGNSEKMTMRGRFDIEEGFYRFTFQSFFKKPFELNRNSNNYIEWTGDPYHPIVNIEAVYKTEKKVDFSPLISNSVTGSSVTAIRDFVYVIAKIRGDLFKPDIKFELDFPPDSPPKRDFYTSQIIKQILENENELNKQVAYIVVFNSFAPSGVGSSLNLSSTGVDLVVNSISDFLSGQINKILNNILSNKLKIPGLYVNFSGALYNPNPFGQNGGGINYDRTSLNLSIGKTLFNNRVVLTFEGNYDAAFQGTSATATSQLNSDLLTNFTTEFLINKSGTIRATIFYKENVDLLTGQVSGTGKSRKYGTSLAFRKDFTKLGDLFKRKKPKRNRLNLNTAEGKKEEDGN